MASNTEHYNLVKPDYADAADVAQLNDNMDIIDSILWQLANAGADEELLKKVQEILDKIGETDDTGGSTTLGSVFAKLNETLSGIGEQKNKLDVVLRILGSGVAEFTTPGSYQVKIPAGITKIKVTACGAGGGGGQSNKARASSGSGGGGGDAVIDSEYTIPDTGTETIINVTVGAGGTPNNDGGATIIGNLVTLAGGRHGEIFPSPGVTLGGLGSGNGGNGGNGHSSQTVNTTVTSTDGEEGLVGKGGTSRTAKSTNSDNPNAACGGPGGGSLGAGGLGAAISADFSTSENATAGTRGSGGGGSAYIYNSISGYWNKEAKSGGNGYAKIEWGL